LKEYPESQKYFDLLLEDDEDNLKWLYKKAECMFGQRKYEESLPTLYKLAYLDEQSEQAQEMLAWGQLMTGNSEKAEKIHTELMEQNPSVRNNINLAHLNLRKGDTQNAYNLYAAAYKLAKNEEEFTEAFWEWRPYLKQIGLDAERLKLMLDSVRMNNN
jgi:tetratricopeptide (TPR) repeat protein